MVMAGPQLASKKESVYKDRFRPSLDCELRVSTAAACGWLEKHPSVRFSPLVLFPGPPS